MNRNIILLSFILLLSCTYKKKNEQTNLDLNNPPSSQKNYGKKISPEEVFDINYKISSIANHKDTSNYIARFKRFEAFGSYDVFEIEELRRFNGLFLIHKVPIVLIKNSDTVLSERGLLFEQKCYWFEGKEAQRLIENSKKYFTNNKSDTSCPNCLDLSYLHIEQNYNGKYTKINKHYFQKLPSEDLIFINRLNTLIANYRNGQRFFGLYVNNK